MPIGRTYTLPMVLLLPTVPLLLPVLFLILIGWEGACLLYLQLVDSGDGGDSAFIVEQADRNDLPGGFPTPPRHVCCPVEAGGVETGCLPGLESPDSGEELIVLDLFGGGRLCIVFPMPREGLEAGKGADPERDSQPWRTT